MDDVLIDKMKQNGFEYLPEQNIFRKNSLIVATYAVEDITADFGEAQLDKLAWFADRDFTFVTDKDHSSLIMFDGIFHMPFEHVLITELKEIEKSYGKELRNRSN